MVTISGVSTSNTKKSLSPVIKTSTFSKIAVANIGKSFVSRISGKSSMLMVLGVYTNSNGNSLKKQSNTPLLPFGFLSCIPAFPPLSEILPFLPLLQKPLLHV